jgi:uridine kinase
MISAFIDLELAEHAALNEQRLGVMDQESVDQIVSRAEELRRERGRVLIALDGRGGAGKSTLARAIVQRIPRSAHIEHDWFHLPRERVAEGRGFDHERLISEVILPFRAGARDLQFLRYNWGYLAGIPDGFHETPVAISDAEMLVIEGCETLHRALASHVDLRVWVDTPPDLSLERGMRRDIEEYHLDPERVRAAWKEWSERESESLARDDRRDRADVIIKG